MDFNLSIPVRVLSGKGVLLQNASLLSAYGKRCLIVTGGKSAVLSGALDDVRQALEAQQIAYDVCSEAGPNPLLSVCHKAGAIAKENGAKIQIKGFVRFETGEGLEKKEEDFAAEVAAQIG